MLFWGIEVKPGKSYAYPGVSARTKLRITQASIGAGKSNARSTLKVNIGDNKPVILCNLVPYICESFSMDLEFEESETLIFSVLGERNVHLAVILLVKTYICHTESSSESDDDCSDLDRYESDFIDDDDDDNDDDDDITNSPSPTYTIKGRKEPSCLNAFSRLKKTHQVSGYKPFDDNPRQVAVDAKDKVHVSQSSSSKETKVGQESNGKTEKKKKKTKKAKEEKGVVAISTSSLEDDGSAADKNARDETDIMNDAIKQKETSDKVNNGVEASEHDGTGKKKKAKKQKETSAVGSCDNIDDKHRVSRAIHSENDGGSKKKRKAFADRIYLIMFSYLVASACIEVSVVLSVRHTPIKGGKMSKKRGKDERPCDSEVACVDHFGAKKLKNGDAVDEDMK